MSRWFWTFLFERVGRRECEFELVGVDTGGTDTDDFAAGVLDTYRHWTNDIQCVAKTTCNDVFAFGVLGGKRAGNDSDLEVRLHKEELLDEARVAGISKLGDWRAGLGEVGFDSGRLGRVLFVGLGKTVELRVSGCLDSEVTHREVAGNWFSWDNCGHGDLERGGEVSKGSTDCERIVRRVKL